MTRFYCPYGCDVSYSRENDLHRRHISVKHSELHETTVIEKSVPSSPPGEVESGESNIELLLKITRFELQLSEHRLEAEKKRRELAESQLRTEQLKLDEFIKHSLVG